MDETAASRIELVAGSQLTGIDFTLVRSRAYRVTAEVQNLTGLNGRIMGFIQPKKGLAMSEEPRYVTLDQKTARMTFQGVTPGSYVLMAGMNEQGRTYNGSVEIEVVDRDLAGLTVALQAGYEIPGYVQVEDLTQTGLGAMKVTASATYP